MDVRPPDFDDARLRRLLAHNWRLEATDLRYAPVGFGSHHWVATTASHDRRFVTVDELGRDDPERRLHRLRTAMRSAVALRDDAVLEFVVAPLPGHDGEVVATLDGAFAVAVLPFVDGRPWPGGTDFTDVDHAALTGLLARLHDATAVAAPYAERDDLEIEARADLEDALERVGEPWEAGPYADGCRKLLASATAGVRQWLAAYDGLAAACRARGDQAVLTHGEPKPDNLLVTAAGPALLDWDTALLAPAARDLWWLAVDDFTVLDRYSAATGRTVHHDDIRLYQLRWDLTDLALFVRQLRRPHVADPDTAVAWRTLQHLLSSARQA